MIPLRCRFLLNMNLSFYCFHCTGNRFTLFFTSMRSECEAWKSIHFFLFYDPFKNGNRRCNFHVGLFDTHENIERFLRIDASFLFACHLRSYTYQAIGSGSERPPHKNTICLILWTLLCGPVLSPAQLSNGRTYASAPSCSSQLKMVDTVKKKYLPGAGKWVGLWQHASAIQKTT